MPLEPYAFERNKKFKAQQGQILRKFDAVIREITGED